ncbi:hypothetical protein V6N13_038953 [Hibiscus sabdariffa]
MAPEEEKLTRRNPLDFPIEWERPKPGRRPDIFPQFSPMKTPLPPPMPYDPPEEDEEEEEKKEEEEEDPEKEEEPENPVLLALVILSLAREHFLVSTNPMPATAFIIDSKWFSILSFDEGYNQLFGDDNLAIHRDGKAVHLTLNERTGSTFVSQDLYLHCYFSTSIKLPADYTAGVVVAFYESSSMF